LDLIKKLKMDERGTKMKLNDTSNSSFSEADEMKKWIDLKNEGVITEEEFLIKRKQFFSTEENIKPSDKVESTGIEVKKHSIGKYVLSFFFLPYGIYFFIKNRSTISKNTKVFFVIWSAICFLGTFVPESSTEETTPKVRSLTTNYNISNQEDGVYEITSDTSSDRIKVINLVANNLTANQAERIEKMTAGKAVRYGEGYEIHSTHKGWANRYFVVNKGVSVEYFTGDGRLRHVYEHIRDTNGKKLNDYSF